MKKPEIKSEKEQAWKRFYGTAEVPWMVAAFAACMGILLIAAVGNDIYMEANPINANNVIGLFLGCGYVAIGGWGISFSKQKKGSFPRNAVVVFEIDWGLLLWLGIFLQFAACVEMLQYMDASPILLECLVRGGFAIVTCFLGILCLFVVRNRRIILLEDSVEYINGLGHGRCWNNREIGRIIADPITESYTVWDKDGNRLFGFKKSMVSAHVLLCRFPVETEMPAKRVEEEQGFANGITALYEKKLRKAGWWLFGLDLLARLLVMFLYFYTRRLHSNVYSSEMGGIPVLKHVSLLRIWDFYFVLAFISLDLFVFTWIFRDALWEDWAYKEDAGQKWKGIHGDILIRQMALMVLSFLPIRGSAERTLQCIGGSGKMFLLGTVLFILLLLPCICRLGKEKLQVRLREFRLWQLLLLSGYTLLVSMVLTNGIFGVTSKVSVHDLAEVIETDWSHSSRGGNQYYAWVDLDNGTEEKLSVSETVYDKINRQEDVVLCRSLGLFGTEFAAIHISGQCPLEY